ncbi:MAG: sensor histidine kinase [Gammaproteobacteria bacterium]
MVNPTRKTLPTRASISSIRSVITNLRRSTVVQITLSYLLILIVTISLLGGYVYWRVSEQMWRQLEQHIATEVESLAEQYRTEGLAGMLRVIDERLARVPDRRSIYLVEDRFGGWLIGNISTWPSAAADEGGWLNFELFDKASGLMTTARVQTFRLPSGARLLVGRDTAGVIETSMLIRHSLFWGIGLAFVLGGLLAMAFSRKAWVKLRAINQTSREVVAGDLQVRIPDLGGDNDLDELSKNINAMLEEINLLMTGIERVSDNIAHDLRTPLARVRNRLATMAAQPEQEMRHGVAACLAVVDELIATFNAILRIARLEYRDGGSFERLCDLGALVTNCVELYAPLAEEKQQTIEISGKAGLIRGDEQLINQAVCNLLDNALKFSNEEQGIVVWLSSDADRCSVEVIDEGCGIKSDEHDKVTQRFYRGELARNTKGNGLGLSLVKAIAEAHHAELQLHDNNPGLKVRLSFPMAATNANYRRRAA